MTRLKLFFALLMLHPRRLHYLWCLQTSGLFDRQFYLDNNPMVHWVFRLFPARHYILMGEAAGLFPNPDFSPVAYLRHNPDVISSGAPPLAHYIHSGRYENRLTKDLPLEATPKGVFTPPLRGPGLNTADHAVVVHIYYPELWDEFHAHLSQLTLPFDLYVTLTHRGPRTAGIKAQIETDWPTARVLVLPNRGRDIYPFLHLINAGWLDHYKAVCKFHSKKSPHRSDGDDWRKHLISGILPVNETSDLLARFLADDSAGIWVADGQHFEGAQWWGSNLEDSRRLLAKLEITPKRDALDFPAGSIYWLKPQILDMLGALNLEFDDFDVEQGQTDGTTAHVIERAIGLIAAAAGLNICQTTHLRQISSSQQIDPSQHNDQKAFVSAFYLPQFHPIAQNDAWWGKGFTEWTASSRATAQFTGHRQPVLPTDLGFYDLRLTETMDAQTALAQAAGIDAFCVYHYWFDGQRLLETPVDRLLERPEIDFPFYLCWANESWRRNWDGLSGEVLMPQSYKDGFATELAQSLLPYFKDPRYQRPDGQRPRFVIYRPEDMPNPAASIAEMRAAWRAAGIGEVELGAVMFHVSGTSDVAEDLFDFWIEMPPHGLATLPEDFLYGGSLGNQMTLPIPHRFKGLIYEYDCLRQRSQDPDYVAALPRNTVTGIMPSWDNTARRGQQAHLAWGANPATFERWLRELHHTRLPQSYRGEIMINAWNEWAEKAILEPNQTYGHGYLRALKRVLKPSSSGDIT